jgi:hypothetical protein
MNTRHLLIIAAAAAGLSLAACASDDSYTPASHAVRHAAPPSPGDNNAQDLNHGVTTGGRANNTGDAGAELPPQ